MKSLRNLFHLVHRTNVVDSSRIKREKKRRMIVSAFLSFSLLLYYYNINHVRTTMYMWSEILCLDKMQSRGQLHLTRLQLNVHALISACRARTRAYVSGLDIEYKKKKERKTSNWTVLSSKKKNVSIFFLYNRKKNKNECVIITLRWCVWIQNRCGSIY